MTPERVVRVQEALARLAEGDAGARERLRQAYAWARGDFAILVAQGYFGAADVAWLAAAGTGLPVKGELFGYFLHMVRRGVAEHERAMDEAAREVIYEIGWLLDEGAPDQQVWAVAWAIGGAVLGPKVLRAIIVREKAWWVRCHIELSGREIAHAA